MSSIPYHPPRPHSSPVARDYAARLQGSRVPAFWHEEIIGYLTERRPVGDFLMALLRNDLKETIRLADPESLAHLADIVAFFHWDTPETCHGSPVRVRVWLQRPAN